MRHPKNLKPNFFNILVNLGLSLAVEVIGILADTEEIPFKSILWFNFKVIYAYNPKTM